MSQVRLKSIGEALSIAISLFKRSPSLAATMMFEEGVGIISNYAVIIPLLICLLYWRISGYLEEIIKLISRGGISHLLSSGAIYEIALALIISLIIGVFVWILASGFYWASCYGMMYKCSLIGVTSLYSMLRWSFKFWRPMVKTVVVREFICIIPVIGFIAWILTYLRNVSVIGGNFFTALVLVYSVLIVVLIFFLFLRFISMFSYILTVCEGKSGFKAFRESIRIVFSNFSLCLIYAILYISIIGGVSMVVGLLSYLGIMLSNSVSLVVAILAFPILRLTRILIYAKIRELWVVNPGVSESFWRIMVGHLKLGIISLRKTVISVRSLAFMGVSAISFALGCIFGWDLSGFLPKLKTLTVPEFGLNIMQVITMPLEYFSHNWSVAVGVCFSGLAFGVFPVFAMIFNGFVVGFVVGLFENPVKALAGIVPHGIFEIPAFIASGALGLELGYQSINYLRGRQSLPEFSSRLRLILYALIGLAPLFIIAGFIEGVITPIIISLVA